MAKSGGGYINLEFVIRKEDHQYSSWCPDLDIASCGDTPEEAIENLKDAIALYLATIDEKGEREDIFKERGIRIQPTDEPANPKSFVTQYQHKVSMVI
jgi:predicted RNase H-like HicB family nuclease